jgi:hypothetical protein
MSQLSNKILSFSPQVYMDFSQTVANPPVFSPNTISFTASGTTTRTTRDLTDNPLGGSGCWRWNQPASVTCLGLNSTTIASFNDGEFSTGIWFKLSAYPGGTTVYPIFGTQPRLTAASSCLVGLVGSASGSTFRVQSGGRVNSTSVVPTLNTWHYLAIVRNISGQTTVYYDNTILRQETLSTATGTTALNIGPVSTTNSTTAFDLSFSDFYISNPGQIDTTQISEIWTAGSTAPNNLKYWNGTAWTVPTNKYQWDGVNWVTLNGKYWNGTAWTNIT